MPCYERRLSMADLYFVLLVIALYAVTHLLTLAVSRLVTPAEKAK